MAGSKRWFSYVSDTGQTWAVQLDESNTEALNGAAAAVPAAAARPLFLQPQGTRLRRVSYISADGLRTIFCVALTTAIYTAANTATPTIPSPIGTGTLAFRERIPERVKSPRWADTGQLDGDADPVP